MNSYGLPHTPLKRACLPFPPPRHNAGIIRKYERFVNLEIQTCESCVFFPPDVVHSHRSASLCRSFVPYVLRKAHSDAGSALSALSRLDLFCEAESSPPSRTITSSRCRFTNYDRAAFVFESTSFCVDRCMRSRGTSPSCRLPRRSLRGHASVNACNDALRSPDSRAPSLKRIFVPGPNPLKRIQSFRLHTTLFSFMWTLETAKLDSSSLLW